MSVETLRVLLVDDHPLVRGGFAMMFGVEEGIEVVGEAGTGSEAIAKARGLRPDVILMDVQMPGMDGIEATRQIVGEGLGKVVILTTFDRDDYVLDGLRAGASGFLLKNAEADRIVEAIRIIGEGNALLAPEVTMRVIAEMADPTRAGSTGEPAASPELDRLTDREREVLTHVARGLSNAEIAAELFLGEATIKTHVSNCLAKLHLRDRVQAVVYAYESGLVSPSA